MIVQQCFNYCHPILRGYELYYDSLHTHKIYKITRHLKLIESGAKHGS